MAPQADPLATTREDRARADLAAPLAVPVVRRPADPRRPTSWARDNRLICALGTRDGSMVPAAQMERYEPVAEVSTWPRTAPDIDPGTGDQGHCAIWQTLHRSR